MTIFIGNLNKQVTEYQLRSLFSEFGAVKSVKIILDNYTGHTKGCGLVEMWKRNQGEDAVDHLQNINFCNQDINLKEVFIETPDTQKFNNNASPWK